MYRTVTAVNTLSTVFDDYTDEARERFEGTHTRVEVHVPNEFATHLKLGTLVVIEADEVHS